MKKGNIKNRIFPSLVIILFLLLSGCTDSAQKKNDIQVVINQSNPVPLFELYTEEQPPFNYIDEKGQISGRSFEVVQELMSQLGVDYPAHLMQWTEGYRIVQSTPNTAIFSTIRTHERENMFKWVGPIAELQYSFYVRSDNPITVRNVFDLHDHGLIAVVRDDAREQYLRAMNMKNILALDSDEDCMKALSFGRAEFWLGTKDFSSQHAKRQDKSIQEFRILDLPVISHRLYIAFNRRTSDQVIRSWQQALDNITHDGTYERIQSRYMPYICSWVQCTS